MKYILKPSLQRIALTKIVTLLWNQNDVRALLTEAPLLSNVHEQSTIWKSIENTVMEKVMLLTLPEKLKEKLMSFVKPIGMQIFKWMKYHSTEGYLYLELPYELCWNYVRGTVEKRKTAELLIKNENLDIYKRYQLACHYCLENYILYLWNKLPEYLKIRLSFTYYTFPATSQQYILNHWAKSMQGSYYPTISNKTAFEFCAKNGENEAAEYFLEKLTSCEREESLVSTAKMVDIDDVLSVLFLQMNIAQKVYITDVLYVLFLEMNEEEQTEILKSKPYEVLLCFLDWPLQNFFNEVANRTWEFLFTGEFKGLIDAIFFKIQHDYKDSDYKLLFVEFWQDSPDAFKSVILDSRSFLENAFHDGNGEDLNVFLQSLSIIEKEKLFYSDHGQSFCVYLISKEKWDLLKIFIQKSLTSKCEIAMFIKDCEKCFVKHVGKDNFITIKHKLQEMFSFSNDSFCDLNKRKCTEIESNSHKKLHHEQ